MKKYIVFLAFCVIFISCEINPPEPYDPDEDETDPIEIIHDIFIPGEQEGEVIFETNDPQYWSGSGFTLWYLLEREEQPFFTREAVVSKISGNASAGYGLIYCFSEDTEYGETFLLVMINTVREYIVAEAYCSNFTEIIPWTESQALNAGYNQNNELRLEYDNSSGKFSLYINNQPETQFMDEDAPVHNSGRQGYIVVISPQDDFPAKPVKVRFLEL
ncbi:MAG: hypothetical protein OQK82_02480 [Candidatus Pacearchaeota archaeon]|nr:hypothetical protein [Candidatus Pacearchaeota archaeon]